MDSNFSTVEELAANESFQNYCLNKTRADVKKWNKFIKANPHQNELIQEAKILVGFMSPFSDTSRPSFSKIDLMKILGFLILIIALFLWVFTTQYNKDPHRIIETALNSNLSLSLMESSKIELRKGSSLSHLMSKENSDKREVWLEGEAYFDIEEDLNKKDFFVHLSNGSIQVHGTKFLVKAQKEETQVFLEEGLITFTISNKKYEMVPGDVLYYSDEFVSVKKSDIRNFDAWRQAKLSFKNESISDVISTLRNSYGLEIEIENPDLLERKITASVNTNDPLLLLEAIAAIYEFELINDETKIVIK